MTPQPTLPDSTQSIVSSVLFGALGAGLVYYAHRSKPSLLTTIAATAGYSLITKTISTAVIAALAPSAQA